MPRKKKVEAQPAKPVQPKQAKKPEPKYSEEFLNQVRMGAFGRGTDRIYKLISLGYDPDDVAKHMNDYLGANHGN